MKSQDTRALNFAAIEGNLSPNLSKYFLEIEGEGCVAEESRETTLPVSIEGTPSPANQSLGFSPNYHSSISPICTVHHGRGFKSHMHALMAAVCVDLASFTGYQDRTKGFEPEYFLAQAQQQRRTKVTVSKKLKVPRHEVLATTLLVPSGAYLSWLAMNGDD